MARNTYIETRKTRAGQRRAFIIGSRIRVQDIYIDSEIHGMTPDQIADGYPDLTLAQVHAALAYYFDYRSEIHEELRQDRQVVDQLRHGSGGSPLCAD